jgi:ParB-like nuclease family protein
MISTGNTVMDAQRAFDKASRAARRHTVITRLRRQCLECSRLAVYDSRTRRTGRETGIKEIPLEQISATVEPSRAQQFDRWFRPAAKKTRGRWERLWIAEQRGEILPPISVIQVGGEYAVLDGHHRVSVARARGAATIDAVVSAS